LNIQGPFTALTMRCKAAILGIALLVLANCASERAIVEQTEQMLAAAGFTMVPAATPERQAQLAALPPHRLLTQYLRIGDKERIGYIYADPDVCHCIFMGDERAYQDFQRLAFERRLMDERLTAAEMEQEAVFNWSLWGPPFWGPGPIVVVHRPPSPPPLPPAIRQQAH
jgi:hypothetical protein